MGVLGSLTVVSPDSGRIRTAERWANRLGGVLIAFIHKTRDPPTKTIKANRVVGDVTGRTCIVVDTFKRQRLVAGKTQPVLPGRKVLLMTALTDEGRHLRKP